MQTPMEQARCGIDVVAGLLPGGQPDPTRTRRFVITSREWREATAWGSEFQLLAKVNGEALTYAGKLMMQPNALNWVRLDWVWF